MIFSKNKGVFIHSGLAAYLVMLFKILAYQAYTYSLIDAIIEF